MLDVDSPYEAPPVMALDHSVAAGRDVNIDQLVVRLRLLDYYGPRLAHRANHPKAMHCKWCGLRGMPHETDACLVCGYDVGKERRAREAAEARAQLLLRRWGKVRWLLCCIIGSLMTWSLILAYPHIKGTPLNLALLCVVLPLMLSAMLEYLCIKAEVWLEYDLPRVLRRLFAGNQLGA